MVIFSIYGYFNQGGSFKLESIRETKHGQLELKSYIFRIKKYSYVYMKLFHLNQLSEKKDPTKAYKNGWKMFQKV